MTTETKTGDFETDYCDSNPRIPADPLTETVVYYVGAPKTFHHDSTIYNHHHVVCKVYSSPVLHPPLISATVDNSIVFCRASATPLDPASDPICSILGEVTFGGCYLIPELERGLFGKSGTSYKVLTGGGQRTLFSDEGCKKDGTGAYAWKDNLPRD